MIGIHRQVYYKRIKRRRERLALVSNVVDLVQKIRMKMPRIGTRKLYFLLKHDLKRLKVGRDKLFKILKSNGLLIRPKRQYHVTTNSYHRFKKHKNIVEHIEVNRPEQVWVSDITYLGNRDNPIYLALVTDAYSKKVMGYDVSDSLNTQGTIRALKMALKNRKQETLGQSLIHHSDRGFQYCSDIYQCILKKYNIKCSMTEKYDPYQNAVAERINGILKQEFIINRKNKKLDIMKKLVKNSIEIYNEIRPHFSNYYLTPNKMHLQNVLKIRTYKTKK